MTLDPVNPKLKEAMEDIKKILKLTYESRPWVECDGCHEITSYTVENALEQGSACPWVDNCIAEVHDLKKVVAAAKAWLVVADTYSQHRLSSDRSVYKIDYMQGREIFRKALAELEQP
jgi:hypothetical protein